ncbi:histidine kinase [Stackebrandtia albiflava]|uniref:Oxygen sensor histidine kinase NreB n=1 Tax=Stackebrandtia albiflava TaxID=406432 RepID=A0A562V539_9ACTN|nr:sensor histidine kinase [Stackebrandtia albiflava]TWJ12990.1 histidine kinase [Stackebrandtia albiflava]
MTADPHEHRIRRWNLWWTLAPYVALLLVAVVALITGTEHPWPVIGLSVAAAAWHAWWIQSHPHWWERAMVPMSAYLAGMLALLTVLCELDGRFAVAAAACYPTVFVALRGGWAYPAVFAVSLLTVPGGPVTVVTGGITPDALVIPLLWAGVVCFIGGMSRSLERETARRGELNRALARANRELTALGAENAALQRRLVDQAHRAGVTAERYWIAREFHDTLAQGLAGITTQLDTVDAEVPDLPTRARRRLHTARRLARDSLVEARRAVEALPPGPLATASLPEAVESVVRDWREQHEGEIALTVTGAVTVLPEPAEAALLRAVQEAIGNVAAHARARRTVVTLSYMEDTVLLDVRDDGHGRHPTATTGLGLAAMRDRIHRLGGEVVVEAIPGTGTAVAVSVPIRATAAA